MQFLLWLPFDELRRIAPLNAAYGDLCKVTLKNANIYGTFFEIKFVLFSSRDSGGVVNNPRIIWANSLILAT